MGVTAGQPKAGSKVVGSFAFHIDVGRCPGRRLAEQQVSKTDPQSPRGGPWLRSKIDSKLSDAQ